MGQTWPLSRGRFQRRPCGLTRLAADSTQPRSGMVLKVSGHYLFLIGLLKITTIEAGPRQPDKPDTRTFSPL